MDTLQLHSTIRATQVLAEARDLLVDRDISGVSAFR